MNPSEFAAISRDLIVDFEKWYAEKGDGGDKNALEAAYLAAGVCTVSRVSRWVNDRLYKSPKDIPEIPEGEGLETYLKGAMYRLATEYAEELVYEPLAQALQKFNDLAMKQVMTILESYSGKKLNGYDDDDGIEGEESEARRFVFNNTLGAIDFVKSGTLKKDALVRTFRALADFYEREL